MRHHSFLSLTLLFATVAQANDYSPSQSADGHPDFNGIWQAVGAAHWNVEDHAAVSGDLTRAGALGATPAGIGVISTGEIPYQPWAKKRRSDNYKARTDLDPATKCYMPGLPRATYLPFPFQIVQTPRYILMAYEFAGASRTVYMNQPDLEAPINTWMGHSRGHWEDQSLVIRVTDQVPDTWLDRAGNFHSDALEITERFTAISPYHLQYEVTIEDPKVYTRPWTMTIPLYRRMEPNIQLLEFKCVEFVEELMYSDLVEPLAENKNEN